MPSESIMKRLRRRVNLYARHSRGKVYRFPSVDLETLRPILATSQISAFAQANLQVLPFRDFGAWQLQVDNGYSKGSEVFEQAIDDLIGVQGMARPSGYDLNRYLDYLIRLSPKWDLHTLFKDFSRIRHLRMTDLGSAIDVAILSPLLLTMRPELRVLEIGGGYGRLAEALLRNVGSKISLGIQMIDVVPSSLALAEAYLKSSGISTVRETESTNKPGAFVRLSRAENISLVKSGSVDIVVNIESFQEMTPDWVGWYLEEVNRITQPGSYFYQSNSFGYKNFFKLELGSKWRLEGSFNHPRHWTDSHRTEIWRRIDG